MQAALRLAPSAAIHLWHAFDVPYEGKLRLAGVAEDSTPPTMRHQRQRPMPEHDQHSSRMGFE